jgi:hypothetical protein
LSLRCEVLGKEKETCKSPDSRFFLSKQRQFANLQKKSGILTYAFYDINLIFKVSSPYDFAMV